MNKKFGMRASLQGYPWHDITDLINEGDIILEIHDGLMDIGYDAKADEVKAKRIAEIYLNAYAVRTGSKIIANFNHTWERLDTGQIQHGLQLSSQLKLSERIQVSINQATITGTASIVTKEMHDSASLTNDRDIVSKALTDPVLEKSLRYYADEAIDNSKPLYGLYKALEIISRHLGRDGRKQLASLAGQSKSYVEDVMETAQLTRHAMTSARNLLPEDECKERAKILIMAYANNLVD